MAIPDDFLLPTCSKCGETFSVPEIDADLDRRIAQDRIEHLERSLITSNHLLAVAVQGRYSTVSSLVDRCVASEQKVLAARKACKDAMARGENLGRLFDELMGILSFNTFAPQTLAHIFTHEGGDHDVVLQLDEAPKKEPTP